jgi:hypothetical protein
MQHDGVLELLSPGDILLLVNPLKELLKGFTLLFSLRIGDDLNDAGVLFRNLNCCGLSTEDLNSENLISHFIIFNLFGKNFHSDSLLSLTVSKFQFARAFNVIDTRGCCVRTLVDLDSFVVNCDLAICSVLPLN